MTVVRSRLVVVAALVVALMSVVMGLMSCSDKPTEPQVSKPSYKIAFLSNRGSESGIYTMSNDGTRQTGLVTDNSSFGAMSWSPDGSRLAYVSMKPPHESIYEIYVIRGDGAFVTRLTSSTHFMGEIEAAPVWSPDGSKIAFRSYRDGNSDIFVMNSDGSNLTNVTHDSTNNYDPVWRTDGMGVTFISARDNGDSRQYGLYFSNTDGTVRELVGPASSYDSLSGPFWFPVGSTFGYLYMPPQSSGMGFSVCSISHDSMNCTGRLFGTSYTVDRVKDFAWSPDGAKLAFASDAEGRWNIYGVSTSGSIENPNRLTNSLAGEGADAPAWSPDGAEIVFAADWTGSAEIYVMNVNGTNVRKLTTSSGSAFPTCAISEY